MSIANLPIEILSHILAFVSQRYVFQCTLVCSAWHKVAARLLFRDVHIYSTRQLTQWLFHAAWPKNGHLVQQITIHCAVDGFFLDKWINVAQQCPFVERVIALTDEDHIIGFKIRHGKELLSHYRLVKGWQRQWREAWLILDDDKTNIEHGTARNMSMDHKKGQCPPSWTSVRLHAKRAMLFPHHVMLDCPFSRQSACTMKNPLHPLGQLRHLTLQTTNLALSLLHGLLAATPQLQELMLLDVHLFTTLSSNARDAEAIAGANLSSMAVNATRVQSFTIEGTYSMESSTFFAFMSQAFPTLRHLYIAILASNISLPSTHIVSNHAHRTTKDVNDLASWLLSLQLTLQSFHFVIQDQHSHTELQWLSDWYWKHHAQHLIEMTLPVSLLLPDSRELTWCNQSLPLRLTNLAIHMDTSVHLHDFVDLCLSGHFSLLRSLALHGQRYHYTRTTSMRLDLYACLSEIPNLRHVELSSMEIHQPPLMNQAPHLCLRSSVLRRCTLLGDHALTRLLTFCSQISRLSLDTVALDRAHTLSGLDENKNVALQVNVDAPHIHLDQLYVRDFIARPRGLDTYTRTLKVYERNTPRHADPDILEHATPSWPLSVGYTLGLTLRFHLGSVDHAYFKLRFVDSLF